MLVPLLSYSQGPAVTGEVNVTCDAWQASNTDGYFAVTGHWIEESTPTEWELKSALLGFTRVSNAHNGERLGQALFKIFKRVGIEHKVCGRMQDLFTCSCAPLQIGHITGDNASNNLTMVQELAKRLKAATGKTYNWRARKIKYVVVLRWSLSYL